MLLADFFAALTNANAVVTIKNAAGKDLVKVNAAGYEQLLASLLAEEVKEITVKSASDVIVTLDGEVSA